MELDCFKRRKLLSVELSESSVSLAVGVYSINFNFSNFENYLNFEKQSPIFKKTKPDARKNMHVQYSLSETTRIHDLSTRKMHRRTAVPTNRTIRTILESLLRPVSIRVLHVIVAVCRLFLCGNCPKTRSVDPKNASH